MIAIRNKQQLISNGVTQSDRKARELALNSLEAAVNAVDPQQLIRSRVILKNSVLKVDEHVFDLEKFRHVYVVGGGKARGSMAGALEQLLCEDIPAGIVKLPRGHSRRT